MIVFLKTISDRFENDCFLKNDTDAPQVGFLSPSLFVNDC